MRYGQKDGANPISEWYLKRYTTTTEQSLSTTIRMSESDSRQYDPHKPLLSTEPSSSKDIEPPKRLIYTTHISGLGAVSSKSKVLHHSLPH